MANIDKLTHLEHVEDEMLNYGVAGCEKIVEDFQELRHMLGCGGSGFVQTKWDGSPSVVCGIDPANGMFFVAKKSAFNKKPELCYTYQDIDDYYGKKQGLVETLRYALDYFSELGIQGVIQGDFLFTDKTIEKNKTIHGHKLHTFTPQSIEYGIPADQPIGKAASKAKVGVVFHTHYAGSDDRKNHKQYLENMSARGGLGRDRNIKSTMDVLIVNNDTPMDDIGLTPAEEREFDSTVAEIKKQCGTCGDFLDYLVTKGGGTGNPSGDEKYHIAPYVKKYFQDEVNPETPGYRNKSVEVTLNQMIEFYGRSMDKIISKLKTPSVVAEKVELTKVSMQYVENNKTKFKAMIELYKLVQNLKRQIIFKLNPLEKTFKTFILTPDGYEVVGHEGYVLHKDGNMVKLVNKLEFTKNNLLYGAFSKFKK